VRVPCTVEYTELEGDHGLVDSVVVTCNRCGSQTESFGQTDASIRRCLVLLREGCDENNYYYSENSDDC
jgi:hypothetical protein